jgi:nucleoside-diphosphate-sugar epimerase
VSLRFPALHSPESFVREMPATFASGKDVRLLWSYLDTRDAAEAVSAAFARPNTGHTKLFLAAADTFNERPTAELVAEFFPGTPLRRELGGHASLMDSSAAISYLSFAPRWSWRDYGTER